MNLIIMDDNMDTMGSVPLFKTLIWVRRYTNLGIFELHTAKNYFPLMNQGAYLYRSDAEELGVIEEVNYSQDENGNTLAYAKGHFSESLFTDRVINTVTTLSGNGESAMRSLVNKFAINPEDTERKINHVVMGPVSGIPDTLELQTTGDNLSEKLYEIGNTMEASHKLSYDYLTNNLAFSVWQGKDRRDTQDENSWAVFSNAFYNIRDVVYNRNESSYKNFAYVAGEGEGANRTIITVDLRKPGEKRKEIWVDARDLQSKDSNGNVIPIATYKAQLWQRGAEKLAEYRKVETVNSGIDASANLVYKVDFDLGDLCTYINTEIGITTDKRITEVMETYEGGSMQLQITFGTDELETVQQLIKREV